MITIRDLSFHYGSGSAQESVLKDINLQVKKSSLIVLSGPSGSGKTTLLTIVGALRQATTGSVQVYDRELVNSSKDHRVSVRRGIGYIFQNHNLMNSLTAIQNVCMSLELLNHGSEKKRKQIALDALASVGLAEKAHAYPSQLSGGQKQRVSVARALSDKPGLILADEPTASLDSTNACRVIDLIRSTCDEKKVAALVVSHDRRWLDSADSVLHLQDGMIKSINTPGQLSTTEGCAQDNSSSTDINRSVRY